jgi:hypothetical protein
MIRYSFAYILISSLLTGCTWAVAQNRPAPKNEDKDEKKDRCGGYKMRVVTPSNMVDYKLLLIKPREDIDTKMVVDPCMKPGPESAMTPIPLEITPVPLEKEKQK